MNNLYGEISKKIAKAFSKIELKECEVCKKFISKKEFEQGEGACFRCWDNPSKLK